MLVDPLISMAVYERALQTSSFNQPSPPHVNLTFLHHYPQLQRLIIQHSLYKFISNTVNDDDYDVRKDLLLGKSTGWHIWPSMIKEENNIDNNQIININNLTDKQKAMQIKQSPVELTNAAKQMGLTEDDLVDQFSDNLEDYEYDDDGAVDIDVNAKEGEEEIIEDGIDNQIDDDTKDDDNDNSKNEVKITENINHVKESQKLRENLRSKSTSSALVVDYLWHTAAPGNINQCFRIFFIL